MPQAHAIILAIGMTALAATAVAQTPPPETTVAKAMTPGDMLAVAKTSRAAKPTDPMTSANLFSQGPFRVNVEHRIAGSTPPSIHERDAELFVVVDGEGTFITGGELVDPVRRNPANIAGSSIRGGQNRAVAKGDVVFIPAGVPHMIADVKSTLTMVATHLPLPTAP